MKTTRILTLIMMLALLPLAACSTGNSLSSGTSVASQSELESPLPASSSISEQESQLASEEDSTTSSSQGERVYYEGLPREDERNYQILIVERGLEEWQIHSLANKGFTFQDIMNLSDEEIAGMLAPGASFMGDRMTEEEIGKLVDSDISEHDVYVLMALGYDYNSAIALTPEQMDFILPNTELVDNLVALGYDRDIVKAAGFLSIDGGYETYKVLLDEVFAKYPDGTR